MSKIEWFLALRLLMAKRSEGGVTIATVISILGIMLSVAALIVTLAVRTGFREDFVNSLTASNAHLTIASLERQMSDGRVVTAFPENSITLTYPSTMFAIVRGQVMIDAGIKGAADVHGIHQTDFSLVDGLTIIEGAWSDEGILLGTELAKSLNVTVGDTVRLLTPDGPRTAFGTSPRVSSYPIAGLVKSGRWDIDRSRIYMPMLEAQTFFNRDGLVDELHVFLENPETVDAAQTALLEELTPVGVRIYTWKDVASGVLRALDLEDRVMFIILSTLITIASMSIISGMVMLVRNKHATVGILRTLGLSQSGVGRVFFLCGTFIGLIGITLGTALGITLALNLDAVLSIAGKDLWDPSIRSTYSLPSTLRLDDIVTTITLTFALTMVATLIPAWLAARLNPVEALDV